MSDGRAHRVVVLQFVSGPRVDIVPNSTEREAIAKLVSVALGSATPPDLPLLAAHTAAIPEDAIRALLNGGTLIEVAKPPPAPSVPILGIVHAMRAYGKSTISGAKPETVATGREALAAFFDRYGVTVDFSERPILIEPGSVTE